MRSRRIALSLIGGLLFLGALSGETLSLEQIILMARESNPDLLDARNDLKTAENDLVDDFRWSDSSLKLSGDWDAYEDESYQSMGEDGTGTLSFDVAVLDQLSLDGSVNTDSDISAGITVKPFNMTSTTLESQTTLDNAQKELLFSEAELDWDVLNLALALSLAEKNARWALAMEELESDQYQASHALYVAGDLTYEELLTAMDDLTDAEDDSLTYASEHLDASQELWSYLSHFGENTLEELTLQDGENLADRLLEELEALEDLPNQSQDVSEARNDLLEAQRDWEITWEIHPGLSVSAGLSGKLDESEETKAELSLSLTLSESSFNRVEREILAAEVEVKEAELNQALYESELDRKSLLAAVDQAKKARESAQRDLERKIILAAETALLHEQGDRTVLEKREAELEQVEAEIKLFQRYTEEVEACTDYLALYPEREIDPLELL